MLKKGTKAKVKKQVPITIKEHPAPKISSPPNPKSAGTLSKRHTRTSTAEPQGELARARRNLGLTDVLDPKNWGRDR